MKVLDKKPWNNITLKEIQTKLTMGSVLSSKYQDNFKIRELYNEILMLRVEENSVQRTKTFLETENEYKNIWNKNRKIFKTKSYQINRLTKEELKRWEETYDTFKVPVACSSHYKTLN